MTKLVEGGPEPRATTRIPDVGALLSKQPKRADEVFMEGEWKALAGAMNNGNARRFQVGRHYPDGAVKYPVNQRLSLRKAVDWAWDSITGRSKKPIAFTPCPWNPKTERSTWCGMDFDAHDDSQIERARDLAFAAFMHFATDPEVFVIFEQSGRGWHLFLLDREPKPINEWCRKLTSCVRAIGLGMNDVGKGKPVQLFPDGADVAYKRFGPGLRCPGSYNPRSRSHSMIVHENIAGRFDLREGKDGGFWYEGESSYSFTHTSKTQKQRDSDEFSRKLPGIPELALECLNQHRIDSKSSRNANLIDLTSKLFSLTGRGVAERLVIRQHREATVPPKDSEQDHVEGFGAHWRALLKTWRGSLSEAEGEAYDALTEDLHREAFKIVKVFADRAKDGDFPLSVESLGERLGAPWQKAAYIRARFVELGIIERTSEAIRGVRSARYKWTCGRAEQRSSDPDWSVPTEATP